MVPHFVTALTAPPSELEQHILNAMPAIERWFRLELMEHTPPFYCSVNIRDAGFKIAPLDTDLFPKHWHNLSSGMVPLAAQAAQAILERICPDTKGLLLIPENDPPTSDYWSSIWQLQQIFRLAGLEVHIGSIDPRIQTNTNLALSADRQLFLQPVLRESNHLNLTGFMPCAILLNHELISGIPGILEEIEEQYLLPPIHASQSLRSKSQNYLAYAGVAKRFSKLLGIDPWLISPFFSAIDTTDLNPTQVLENIQNNVSTLLPKIRKKYKEFGVDAEHKPFVVIKASHGNSNSNIVTVHDASALSDPAALKPLFTGKTQNIPPLVIQEGVHSAQHIDGKAAEPEVYMIDRYVVGGFYKIPLYREDPNVPTMQSCIRCALEQQTGAVDSDAGANQPNRFYMYGVMARLAMIATAYELEVGGSDATDNP